MLSIEGQIVTILVMGDILSSTWQRSTGSSRAPCYYGIWSMFVLWGGGGGGGPYIQYLAGGGHVRVNQLKPCTPIYAYTEHAQFVNESYFELWRCTVAWCNTFHEGQGM